MATLEPTLLRTGLKQNQRKLTRARQAVLDIVATADRHLTPAEIYQQAKVKYPHLGLTTVYRTLDLLVELGYLQRVHSSEGCHSYAPRAHAHGHQLVCLLCGRTEEFSRCDLDRLIQTIQKETGFQINVHMLELMGYCPACQVKRGARKKARGK
jgi:Fur family ferric uptake transcriptional regulator